jgi:glycosyltransferase involved in cell wall biosynthesis
LPPFTRPLRIVQVNDVAHVASALARGLRSAGQEARFIELAKYGARWPFPWKLAALPPRLAAMTLLALRLRLEAPDVIHIHYASQAILGLLTGLPYVVHCHGTDVRSTVPQSRWGRAIAPGLLHAAGVLYSTPDLAPWVRGFRPDARFLPSPVDTDMFHPGGEGAMAEVLISTRLDPVKGPDVIIETVRQIRAIRPATTFTLVDHGSAIAELRAAIGGAARIVPPVPHDRMPELLRGHQVFLGQFGLGTVGQAEFEALACGLPVVANLSDPHAVEVRPPIVSSSNATEAASAVAELLDDPDRRSELSVASRMWTMQQRSLPVVVASLLDRYAEFGMAG